MKRHSEKDLQHSQIPGPTDLSVGVMTHKKDCVYLLSSCSVGKREQVLSAL